MTNKTEHQPSDLALEQLALGEVPTVQVLEHRREEPEIATRLAELARSNEAILQAYPPERMAAQIRRRTERRTPRRWAMIAAGSTALLAAFSLVLLPIDEPTERTKGLRPQLLVWRKVGGEAEPLAAGTVVKQGDLLQLGYVSGSARYGVIVSLDGRGQATLHYPTPGKSGNRLLERSGSVLLEDAYELDDAPGFERFFFVSGKDPLDADAIFETISQLREKRDAGRNATPSFGANTVVIFDLTKAEHE